MHHLIKMSWEERAICGPQVSPGEQAEGKPSTHASEATQVSGDSSRLNQTSILTSLPPENLYQLSM